MEAALFTLDIVLLIALIWAVRRNDRGSSTGDRSLGLFAYLEHKSDEIQKGLKRSRNRRNA